MSAKERSGIAVGLNHGHVCRLVIAVPSISLRLDGNWRRDTWIRKPHSVNSNPASRERRAIFPRELSLWGKLSRRFLGEPAFH